MQCRLAMALPQNAYREYCSLYSHALRSRGSVRPALAVCDGAREVESRDSWSYERFGEGWSQARPVGANRRSAAAAAGISARAPASPSAGRLERCTPRAQPLVCVATSQRWRGEGSHPRTPARGGPVRWAAGQCALTLPRPLSQVGGLGWGGLWFFCCVGWGCMPRPRAGLRPAASLPPHPWLNPHQSLIPSPKVNRPPRYPALPKPQAEAEAAGAGGAVRSGAAACCVCACPLLAGLPPPTLLSVWALAQVGVWRSWSGICTCCGRCRCAWAQPLAYPSAHATLAQTPSIPVPPLSTAPNPPK